MMVALTSKQREELNLAIHEYLVKHNFSQAAHLFAEEADLNPQGAKASAVKDILERKWTSIASLKKDIMELTKQNKQLKEQSVCERCGGGLVAGTAGSSQGAAAVGDGLPRQPEKYVLKGHKSRITKVSMHPIYSDVVSSSEDGTVKIWDVE